MLFPDAAQRILPFPIRSFDRQRGLEFSLERSFRRVFGQDLMSRSIYNLRPDAAHLAELTELGISDFAHAGYAWESRQLLAIVSTFSTHPLLLGTTRVCSLKLANLLIIERYRSATVPFFTHEVVPSRRLMTT